MTDLKIMETNPHTYEVVQTLVDKAISQTLSIETDRRYGKWIIRISDTEYDGDPACVCLSGAEAAAVAEFINSHVRKRW